VRGVTESAPIRFRGPELTVRLPHCRPRKPQRAKPRSIVEVAAWPAAGP